ncbi:MAG: MFS transporter [Anaerolineaceae bacterium]|nr:MFS transporter [Anaerolineaceae bacterium]
MQEETIERNNKHKTAEVNADSPSVPKDGQAEMENHNPELPKNWLGNYVPMFIGQMFSLVGSAVVQFALIWHLTEQTGSATVLAAASLVALLPGVFLGPFAGALVDRWNRKITMIVADLIVTLAILVLIALFASGLIQVWHIYLAIFIRAVAGTFQQPAMSASITLMVPREHFTRLSGLNQALGGIINIISPPLGALLIAVWPLHSVLAVDVVTAAIAILLLLVLVKVPQPHRTDEGGAVSVKQIWGDVSSAFHYVKTWPGMLKLGLMAGLINFTLAPTGSLLPLMVTKHFGGGAVQLSWLESAMGIGIVVGGLILGVWGGFKKKMFTTLTGIILMAAGITGIGLSPKGMLSAAIVFSGLTGFAAAFANGPLGAIMHEKIPPEMQGRVFTMTGSFCMAAMPLGIMLAAPLAERFGIPATYVMAGVLTFFLGLFGFLQKDVYTLDDQEPGGKRMVKAAEKEAETH